MGQYFKGLILKENWKKVKNCIEFACSSWDFGVGAKLMEHSWIGNFYLNLYVQLLGTKYYGYPFVWCGDYCDHLKTSAYKGMEVRVNPRLIEPRKENEILSKDETPEILAQVTAALEKYMGKDWKTKFNKDNYYTTVIPYSDEAWKLFESLSNVYIDYELDLYEKAGEWIEKNKDVIDDLTSIDYNEPPYYKYLVNLDKKEYVVMPVYNVNSWKVHPLSLLCANSNQRGGGDYYQAHSKKTGDEIECSMELVGTWAYNHIGFTNDKDVIKGFKKLVTKFKCDF
jgi:hypothetical protein